MNIRELEPIFTKKVTDFYGVNKVITKNNGQIILTDCGRPIMKIKDNKPHLMIRHLGNWEVIAVREFLLQQGFECGSKFTDIRAMYG